MTHPTYSAFCMKNWRFSSEAKYARLRTCRSPFGILRLPMLDASVRVPFWGFGLGLSPQMSATLPWPDGRSAHFSAVGLVKDQSFVCRNTEIILKTTPKNQAQFANDYCSDAADERRGGFSRPGERRKKRRMRPDFDASAFRP